MSSIQTVWIKLLEIADIFQKECPLVKVHVNTICAVISAHTGLDCIAYSIY